MLLYVTYTIRSPYGMNEYTYVTYVVLRSTLILYVICTYVKYITTTTKYTLRIQYVYVYALKI